MHNVTIRTRNKGVMNQYRDVTAPIRVLLTNPNMVARRPLHCTTNNELNALFLFQSSNESNNKCFHFV